MARKLNTNLVALASAAIVTVYGVGYAQTRSAADRAAATSTSTPPAAAAAPVRPTPDAATAIARAIAATQPPLPPSPTATATPTSGYRDGTYTGSGTSRRGDISVAVTIEGGAITSARITHATTYYPTSDIARLPGQVVSRQSAQVDFVSGATESSRAFRGAVVQALSQASA